MTVKKKTTTSTELAVPSPLAVPPHVASGELITSAWGNGVVDELANLGARVSYLETILPKLKVLRFLVKTASTNTLPAGPAYGTVQLGNIVLPSGVSGYDVVVTAFANIQDAAGEACNFAAGFGGTMVTETVGTTDTPGSETPMAGEWVTASFTAQWAPGTYRIDCFGQATAAGGWIQTAHATITAIPYI